MLKDIKNMTLNRANILGVSINSSQGEVLLKKIVDLASGEGRNNGNINSNNVETKHAPSLQLKKNPLIVFTPNPEFIVEAWKNKEFRELLNKADINLADGIGLVWAGKLLRHEIEERVSGADIVERLLEVGNRERWEIGIIGARRGNLQEEELLKRLREKYPNICFINLDQNCKTQVRFGKLGTKSDLVGILGKTERSDNQIIRRSEFSDISESPILRNTEFSEYSENVNDIRISKFNIVFACQGMKKQEQWIWENKDRINANVFMGVGGSLDFLSGFTKRAPLFIRQFGLEWFWRVLQKPSHLKRVWRAVFVFNWLVIKERYTNG